MLLSVTAAKSHLIAAAAALSIAAVPAAPAHAWGDKEQGFLAGVVTALVIDGIVDANKKAKTVAPAPVYAAPVYVAPAPVVYSSISTTPAARAFNSYTTAERKAIQRTLKSWGYYHGSIDGTFGRGTYNAVTAFAADEGASSNLKSTAGAFAIYDGLIF